MATLIWLKCLYCEEITEVFCDGDNAMLCPECRGIDNFEDIEDTQDT